MNEETFDMSERAAPPPNRKARREQARGRERHRRRFERALRHEFPTATVALTGTGVTFSGPPWMQQSPEFAALLERFGLTVDQPEDTAPQTMAPTLTSILAA